MNWQITVVCNMDTGQHLKIGDTVTYRVGQHEESGVIETFEANLVVIKRANYVLPYPTAKPLVDYIFYRDIYTTNGVEIEK